MRIGGLRAAAAACLALSFATASQANETITVALSSGGTAWDFSVADFGKRMGFFAEQGINVEIAFTDNTTASIQAVIAGSADIANAGVTQFMAATTGGAPLKMISSSFTGTSDWLWYVRSDSPIQSFKDLIEKNTIGVNSLGSSAFMVVSLGVV